MRTIKAETINEVITSVEPLPQDAKMIVFDGVDYVIYEDGDELPVIE